MNRLNLSFQKYLSFRLYLKYLMSHLNLKFLSYQKYLKYLMNQKNLMCLKNH